MTDFLFLGELDQDFSDALSEDGDSDSLIEEHSDVENDLEVEKIILDKTQHHVNGKISKSERENLSSLSKAGLLLNKQLKKANLSLIHI